MTTGPDESHWVDRLSVRVSRETTLKGALAVGLALVFPGLRAQRSSAATRPPCYGTCRDLAVEDYKTAIADCRGIGFLHGALLYLFTSDNGGECIAKAQVAFRRDFLACDQPECGDRAKYPGGNKPHQVCTPGEEYACGDTCCNTITDCCQSKSTGDYMCCARVPGGETCSCAK